MAKVYISFLGTNDYVECIYDCESSGTNQPVRFVQETTLKRFAENAKAEDSAFIFTTDEAYEKNWVDDGHWDREKQCRKKCQGLETRIGLMNLPFPVERIRIPAGHSKPEIWEIFEIVYDVLKEGDDVVLDITHAFRSIPMLAMVILNYARVLKKINLLAIYYGAFEALGTISEAKNMSVEKRKAPLLDLISLDLLMRWTFAVDRFLGAGDAEAVSKLALDDVAPLRKETRGKDTDATAVKGVATALNFFSSRLATCRGPEIVQAGNFLKNELGKAGNTNFIKAFYPLFEHISKQVAPFIGDEVNDGIQAAQWCLNHNLIQQGFTIRDETLISYFVRRSGKDINDKTQREIASAAASLARKNTPEEEWSGEAGKNKKTTKKYLELHKKEKSLLKLFGEISQYRDDLNHAGYRQDMKKPEKFKNALKQILEGVCRLLEIRSESEALP
ncbi:MAG: TIGR02221 family CRISPR-associated protein [Desulfobacterales bacterium]|nr:TIGR02221 family CRISPR-associated protein [Desulfobacterales bacterium]